MEPGNRKILVYQPAYAGMGIVALVILLVVVAYLLFQRGISYGGEKLERLVQERGALEQTIDTLGRQNEELHEQVVILERSSEIDRRASLEVRNEFSGLQEDLLELRKELEFYRGIVSPGDSRPGLRIQRFHLEPAREDGSFFYSLTLTQVKGNERYVRGVIEMEIEGLEDGEPKVLLFNKLAEDNSKALKYKFRYFQNFEGEIWIPARFSPEKVRIMLKPRGKGQPSGIEETMDWPV